MEKFVGIDEINEVITYLKRQLSILRRETNEMESMVSFWEARARELLKLDNQINITKKELVMNIIDRSSKPLSFQDIRAIYEHIRGEESDISNAINNLVREGKIEKIRKGNKIFYGKSG